MSTSSSPIIPQFMPNLVSLLTSFYFCTVVYTSKPPNGTWLDDFRAVYEASSLANELKNVHLVDGKKPESRLRERFRRGADDPSTLGTRERSRSRDRQSSESRRSGTRDIREMPRWKLEKTKLKETQPIASAHRDEDGKSAMEKTEGVTLTAQEECFNAGL